MEFWIEDRKTRTVLSDTHTNRATVERWLRAFGWYDTYEPVIRSSK